MWCHDGRHRLKGHLRTRLSAPWGGRCRFDKLPQTTDVILRYVPFLEIEKYLRNGWMVVVPAISHPALDAYRVLMVRHCECKLEGE